MRWLDVSGLYDLFNIEKMEKGQADWAVSKFLYGTRYIIRGTHDKFPDFFRMGSFIDSTYMKLKSPSK